MDKSNDKGYQVINGDSIDVLKGFPDNFFDSVVTDPPYGIQLLGKEWDYDVPKADFWKEVYRVVKPGSYLLAFSAPRTYHRATIEIEDAGFTIADQLQWMITTKMPSGNNLKPCHEPITLAQKPVEGTIKSNFEKYGVGYINTTDTRIPWEGKPPKGWVKGGHQRRHFGDEGKTTGNKKDNGTVDANPNGRYPSNIIGLFDNTDHQKYFYAPRVSSKERGTGNNHPSPKPVDLMKYLITLVTPKGGKVLDPFNGSGSTGLGAMQAECEYVGIEMDKDYVEISNNRLQAQEKELNIPSNSLFT